MLRPGIDRREKAERADCKEGEYAREMSAAWIRLCRIRCRLSIGPNLPSFHQNEMTRVQNCHESERTRSHTNEPREG
jgi:hypothetical protein